MSELPADQEIAIRRAVLEQHHPAGICSCGHLQSNHAGIDGHGPCRGNYPDYQGAPTRVTACDCEKFTWVGFDPVVEKIIDRAVMHAREEATARAELAEEIKPAGDTFDF